MELILLNVYEFASMVIPAFIVLLIYKYITKLEPAWNAKDWALMLALTLELAGILYMTGTPSLYDVIRYGGEIRLDRVSLIPFSDIGESLGQYILNAILFIPLGFLLPCIWKSYQKLTRTAAFCFAFSLCVELLQLFNFRATDIDDLLMNTIGGIIGFGLYLVFAKVFSYSSARNASKVKIHGATRNFTFKSVKDASEAFVPVLIALAVVFGKFLLVDEMGLASFLFGF